MKHILTLFVLTASLTTASAQSVTETIRIYEAEKAGLNRQLEETRKRIDARYREALDLADKTFRASSDLDGIVALKKLTEQWEKKRTVPDSFPGPLSALAPYVENLRQYRVEAMERNEAGLTNLAKSHTEWLQNELRTLKRQGHDEFSPQARPLSNRLKQLQDSPIGQRASRMQILASAIQVAYREESGPKWFLGDIPDNHLSVNDETLVFRAHSEYPMSFVHKKAVPNGYAVEIQARGIRACAFSKIRDRGVALYMEGAADDAWHTYRMELVDRTVTGYIDGVPQTVIALWPNKNKAVALIDDEAPFDVSGLQAGIAVARGQQAAVRSFDFLPYK